METIFDSCYEANCRSRMRMNKVIEFPYLPIHHSLTLIGGGKKEIPFGRKLEIHRKTFGECRERCQVVFERARTTILHQFQFRIHGGIRFYQLPND
jgi:hypothetical protein